MPNNIFFEVTPTMKNNKVEWEMCRVDNGQKKDCGKGDGNYPDVSLGKGQGATTFQIKIDDPANLGIQFAATPVTIKKGNPTGADNQINLPPGGGGTVTTFVDRNTLPDSANPNPVTITYGLNFVGKDGKTVTAIDPDITNGGNPGVIEPPGFGGRESTSYADYLPALAIGLLAGILLTLVVQYFRR
jgi:hypothetical protein